MAWWHSNLLHGARRYFGGSRLPCTFIVLHVCFVAYMYVPVLADVGYNPLFCDTVLGFSRFIINFHVEREIDSKIDRYGGPTKNVHLRFVAKNIARITVQ